ncbi:pyroglutamyl-peptidase I [Bdellovibrio sp. HCB185ZH]|uniref:pyroglutamyl-peptidase I family protein n=1 Tax=Bdellovibrio sp. HCB185ZH TaxID=3394235 RepID=UPI0039A58943
MKRILVTGFEPFGNQEINPSELLATELAASLPFVRSLILPVDFKEAFQELLKFIEHQSQPFDSIVMLGQASGRSQICLERMAHNWMENKKTDKKNPAVPAQQIFPGHPEAVMTTLPVEEIRDQLNLEFPHAPVVVTLSAGVYVCNNLYYKVLSHQELKNTPALFIHVPLLPEQQKDSSHPVMEFKTQVQILTALIESLKI